MRRLLVLLLLFPLPLLAQTGAVTGVALDSIGNTVAGAVITVCTQGSPGIPCSPVTASTTSNGQGAFSVTVPVGTYTVTVFRLGVVATSSTVVVAPSNITVANNTTYSGTVTFTGATTVSGTLNGECPVTNTASLSAANLVCTTSSTKIHIWPGAGVVSGAGLTIAAQLQVDAGSQISGSPTISGIVTAGPYQIFTGTPTFTSGINQLHQTWFPGADMHAQWTNAYNAGPAAPSFFTIILDPNPAGGPWTTTTTASMTTVNKYAQVMVATPSNGSATTSGFFENFTPTITGSAATITNASFAAGTVTITAANTFSVGQVVTVRGCTTTDYNGVWIVATASGTQFTYSASLSGGIAAGCSGTAAVSPVAIGIDWTPAGGGAYATGAGIMNFSATNNGCIVTGGGCGNYAVGLLLGRVNGGAHAALFMSNRFTGFGAGIAKVNGPNAAVGWGINYTNNSLAANNYGLFVGTNSENDTWYNGRMAINGINLALKSGNAEMTVHGGSSDSPTICATEMSSSSTFHGTDVHFENQGVAGNFCVVSGGGNPVASFVDIKGGFFLDDNASGTTTPLVTAGIVMITGTHFFTAGQGMTSTMVSVGNSGKVDIFNDSAGTVTDAQICGVAAACYVQVTSGARKNIYLPGNFSLSGTIQNLAGSVSETLPTTTGTLVTGQQASGINFDAVYGTYRVTADQTITAGASLTNIPGLSWTMPANTALNVAFHCEGSYNETTGATSMQFGVQDVTVAPTNIYTKKVAWTSISAASSDNTPTLTTTTATGIGAAFTPSAATTVFNFTIDGMIEQPSNASSSVINIMAQFTTNNGVIKRGSYCQVF